MQPRTREVLDHLDRYRSELGEGVAAVPEALRSQRPTDGAWSVAEILGASHAAPRLQKKGCVMVEADT